jgi:hypothetical protein
MKRLPFLLLISGLTGILFLGANWTTVAQADSKHHSKSKRHFTLEVSMDPGTAGVNPSSLGVPGRALVGVFNGNIYPKGTLDDGFDLASGGKIGTWRCHFTGLNTVAFDSSDPDILDHPLTGAVTYYFQLEPTGYDRAESMIMVMGLNSHTDNDDHSERRVLAVVGGTGRYANATGEVRETVIGRNNVDGRNLRFHFRLRDAKNGHGRGYGHDYDDD